jgi:hypothetical protein
MNTDNVGGYKYIVAYLVVIGLVLLLARTKLGYSLIYYFLAMSLIVLFLTHYNHVVTIFQDASPSVPESGVK